MAQPWSDVAVVKRGRSEPSLSVASYSPMIPTLAHQSCLKKQVIDETRSPRERAPVCSIFGGFLAEFRRGFLRQPAVGGCGRHTESLGGLTDGQSPNELKARLRNLTFRPSESAAQPFRA